MESGLDLVPHDQLSPGKAQPVVAIQLGHAKSLC